MRWHRLFSDLEAQLEASDTAELEAEIADRTRIEQSLLRSFDRLSGARSRPVTVTVKGPTVTYGVLTDLAPEWLLVDLAPGEALIPWAAVLSVAGLTRQASAPGREGEVVRRLTLGSALRALARGRGEVRIDLVDATALSGTIDRVGADHLELAEHPHGESRRPSAVTGVRLLPFHAVARIRSQP